MRRIIVLFALFSSVAYADTEILTAGSYFKLESLESRTFSFDPNTATANIISDDKITVCHLDGALGIDTGALIKLITHKVMIGKNTYQRIRSVTIDNNVTDADVTVSVQNIKRDNDAPISTSATLIVSEDFPSYEEFFSPDLAGTLRINNDGTITSVSGDYSLDCGNY